jgi:outer membrane lipoprotein-sorting protein
LFEVVPETGELARIIVRQAGGIQMEFRFENWRFDPPIPDSMFRFEPPRGVAIVNGDSTDGKIPGN